MNINFYVNYTKNKAIFSEYIYIEFLYWEKFNNMFSKHVMGSGL